MDIGLALWVGGSLIVGFIAGVLVDHNTKNGVSKKVDALEVKLDTKLEEVKTKIDNKNTF